MKGGPGLNRERHCTGGKNLALGGGGDAGGVGGGGREKGRALEGGGESKWKRSKRR